MRLTREQLNAYNGMLHEFQSGAESCFRDLMEAWRAENPDAKVSEAREFCIFAVNETLGIYGLAAEELAAQMFETVCEEEGIEASAEIPEEAVPHEMIENAAHYNAGKLVDGDWAAFVGAEAALVNYYARQSAYETMKKSCKDNDVRWARVPTGRETCGYCFMLASRGFDYVSEDTAHAGSHRHCDCVVMPGVPGRTKVDGYDPDELYKRWKECEEAAGSKNFRDVIKEVETRDWDWVWGGKKKAEPADVLPDKPKEAEFSFGDRVYSGTTFSDSFGKAWAGDSKKALDDIYDLLKDSKVPEAAHVWGSVFGDVEIVKTPKRRASFSPGTNRVTLGSPYTDYGADLAIGKPMQTVFHEVGHAVDDWLAGRKFAPWKFDEKGNRVQCLTEDGELGRVIKSDWDALVKSRRKKKKSDAVNEIIEEMRGYPLAVRSDVSDWVEALTGIGYPLGAGHGPSYWKRRGGVAGKMQELSSEAFAELFDSCMANHESWDMMDKYFPSATKWFADKMKEVSEWTPAE